MATCGGTTTSVANSPPSVPKFDTLMVAPRSASGAMRRVRASVVSLVQLLADRGEVQALRIPQHGDDETVFSIDSDTDMDIGV